MLATLLDRSDGEALPLPAELEERYGGPLRLPERVVFANFVSTLDGIVSYDAPGIEGAQQVSGGHPADRFILALLRAVADVVIVGAATVRREPQSVWTATSVMPKLAPAFAELRTRLGRAQHATTIVVTGSGEIDPSLPAFRGEAPIVIATTRAGAEVAGSHARATVAVIADRGPFAAAAVVAYATRELGARRVLTEGGPTVLGQFFTERILDELFLTMAPRVAGRSTLQRRLGLVEAAAFEPTSGPRAHLVSLKSADDFLFTRYAFRGR